MIIWATVLEILWLFRAAKILKSPAVPRHETSRVSVRISAEPTGTDGEKSQVLSVVAMTMSAPVVRRSSAMVWAHGPFPKIKVVWFKDATFFMMIFSACSGGALPRFTPVSTCLVISMT